MLLLHDTPLPRDIAYRHCIKSHTWFVCLFCSPKSEQGARAESKRIRVMGGGAPAHIEAGTAGGGMAGAGMTAGGGAGMGTTTAGAGAVPEAGTPTA